MNDNIFALENHMHGTVTAAQREADRRQRVQDARREGRNARLLQRQHFDWLPVVRVSR